MDLKEKWWEGVDWSGSGHWQMAGCFERGIESSGSRFQASAAVWMRSSLFWVVTQRMLVVWLFDLWRWDLWTVPKRR